MDKIARITIGCAVVIIQIYVWRMVWAGWVYPGLAGDAKIPAREWIVFQMYALPFWLAALVGTLFLLSFKVVRYRWKYGLAILIFMASFVLGFVASPRPYDVFVQRLAARVQKDVTLQTLREFMASQREGLKSARQLGQDASGRIDEDDLPIGIRGLYPDSYFTADLFPSFDGGVGYVVVDWGSPYLRWGFVVLDNPSAMGPTLGGVRAVHHLDNTVYCYIRY